MAKPALTFRRLSGLDRSGPPPPETQAGAPLRPWTIPNAIGFVRAALIPVFLVLALSSDSGTDPLPAAIFAVAVWGDYADGIAARVTGQYSRLGALLDPIELLMLIVGQYAVRHGVELRINWPGRWSVWPLMGAIFLALCGVPDVPAVLLYVGLVLALWATVLYGASAVRQLREPSTSA